MSPRRRWKPTRMDVALLAVAGALVLAALAALGLAAWAGSYLRSPQFRELLAEHAGRALGGRAELAPLRWDGGGVFSEKFRVEGGEDSALAAIEARHLRAGVDWRTVFSGVWKVEMVDMLEVEAALAPRSKTAAPADTASMPLPPGPFRVEVEGFRAARASLDFGSGGAVRDTQLVIERADTGWNFSASGGRFLATGYPEILVEKMRGRLADGHVHLTSASGRLEKGGDIRASGEFGRDSRLLIEWAEVDTDSLLPRKWSDRLHGTAAGNATLSFAPGNSSTEGRIMITDGRLREMHLMNQIAAFTGSPQFRRMPLQEVSADFRHRAGSWEVRNFALESKGLLRVTGRFDVAADGQLSGDFEVGVAPQVLQWIPGSRERVFTRNENGYVWTRMRLSGTAAEPREDLSPRLAAAARDEVIERGSEVLGKPAEAARGLLDALAPLFR
ncbi:MAG: hypothetical protein N2322_03280 [Terrimicrobiaceae bacterium]|nr:hypothetical protein [Terrimicrobiaceae bacterium]